MNSPLLAQHEIAQARRLVVKVGSSSLTDSSGHLSTEKLGALVKAIAERRLAGDEVVFVSSGAQAAAMRPLGLKSKPKDLATAQAAASVGQGLLMAEYKDLFEKYELQVGQVLLTAEDVFRRTHYRNAQRALERLLTMGVVPIINENDTVATDEIRFGDNDRLAALVAHLIKADALILLTDVDALYTAAPDSPGAQKIEEVHRFDQVENLDIQTRGSAVGTGGMVTKVQAAALATSSGIPVLLAAATQIEEALAGDPIGTWFHPTGRRLATRQLWLGYAAQIHGRIIVDDGAVRAITVRGASLLPAGIVGTDGTFTAGQAVEIVSETGLAIARGISGFSSERIPQVKGLSIQSIEETLGEKYAHEAVHRDELVVMARHRRLHS